MPTNTTRLNVGCQVSSGWIAKILGAQLIGADVPVCGATQNSRAVQVGMLFVALPGNHADGHEYVAMAAAEGAAAALVTRPLEVDVPQIVVPDVESSLQQVAKAWRACLSLQVMAITGSCGKTTVKQMLASIFEAKGKTLATAGNLNNQLGVPLTLLGLTAEHEYAVIEMGASGKGDIDLLCDMAAPNVSVITMVAEAHLEGFGSLQGVAEAKGEIYSGLADRGIAILNADEPWQSVWQPLTSNRQYFSTSQDADVRVDANSYRPWINNEGAGSEFKMTVKGEQVGIRLPIPGRHNVVNAAAAAAVASAAGASPSEIAAGLSVMANVAGRLAIRALDNGALVVDDSYNANPASVRAAAQWLEESNIAGKKILVLGEMAELGADSVQMHAEMGAALAKLALSSLWVCGAESAEAMAEAYGDNAFYYPAQNVLISSLAADLQAGDAVLVKGSRSAAMEKIIEGLQALVVARSQSSGATDVS